MTDSAACSGGPLERLESRPWGWIALFLALSVLLVGGMLAWWAVFGLWQTLFDPTEPFGLSFDARNHVTLALLLAFVIAGTRWIRQGTARDIERLGGMAGVPVAEVLEIQRRQVTPPKVVRAASFGAAFLLAVVIIPLSSGQATSSLRWDMHHVWAIANNWAIFFPMFNGCWLSIQGWRLVGEFTKTRLRIDLLDREMIASIGRSGSRGAAFWLAGGTLASSLTWGMTRVAPVLAILAVLLAFSTASLLLPAQIVRKRVRDEKHAELGRVRTRIALASQAVLGGTEAAPDQAALLPGLLAYEARIESVREWPYDTPTLVRFALLAVIAMSSWLGGALVERALGVVLD